MTTRKANGASIRAIREALGIRQHKLAAEAGISNGYLSKIESGVQQPEAAVLRAIADALGVPIDAISHVVATPDAVPA